MIPSNTMQNQLEMSRNAHDLAGLDNLRQAAQQGDEAALKEAAQQFEAIFVQMMLKSMRSAQDAIADKDSPFNSHQVKFYRDMHDQQMAVDLSSSGSMGMADLIIQQLSPNKEGYTPASIMRQDGNLRVRAEANNNENTSESAYSPLQPAPLDTESSSKRAVFESPEAFIASMLPLARKPAQELGVDPKALVAQAAVETGWGQYVIHDKSGRSSHNLFGIKANASWEGDHARVDTLEFRDGIAQREHAKFRKYDSFYEAMQDYVSFVKDNPRYQGALNVANNPDQYFAKLQQAGYATDPSYSSKILSVLKKVTQVAQGLE